MFHLLSTVLSCLLAKNVPRMMIIPPVIVYTLGISLRKMKAMAILQLLPYNTAETTGER